MRRQAPPDDAKAVARRRRRAADTARWRSRRRRGVQLFQIEAGPRNTTWQSSTAGCGKIRLPTRSRSMPHSVGCSAGPLLPCYKKMLDAAENV